MARLEERGHSSSYRSNGTSYTDKDHYESLFTKNPMRLIQKSPFQKIYSITWWFEIFTQASPFYEIAVWWQSICFDDAIDELTLVVFHEDGRYNRTFVKPDWFPLLSLVNDRNASACGIRPLHTNPQCVSGMLGVASQIMWTLSVASISGDTKPKSPKRLKLLPLYCEWPIYSTVFVPKKTWSLKMNNIRNLVTVSKPLIRWVESKKETILSPRDGLKPMRQV